MFKLTNKIARVGEVAQQVVELPECGLEDQGTFVKVKLFSDLHTCATAFLCPPITHTIHKISKQKTGKMTPLVKNLPHSLENPGKGSHVKSRIAVPVLLWLMRNEAENPCHAVGQTNA